jgi:signal peptidase I
MGEQQASADTTLPASSVSEAGAPSPRGRGFLAACASLVVPGAGQWIAGRRRRGARAFLINAALGLAALALILWPAITLAGLVLAVAAALFQLAVVVDAYLVGRRSGGTMVGGGGPAVRYLVGAAILGASALSLNPSYLLIQVYRRYCAQTYTAPGESMTPTVRPNDRFVVNKLVPIRPWDVVAFHAPGGRGEDDPSRAPLYLKRAVGMPGDTLQIRGDQLFINGRLTAPPPGLGPYLDEEPRMGMRVANGGRDEVRLGPDEYFFIGDNVPNSYDSRFFRPVEGRQGGAIPRSRIVGRATYIYWPPSRIGAIR